MTAELWLLAAAILIGLAHVGAQSLAFKSQAGNAYTVGARDDAIAASGVAGRLERALRNFGETFPLFAAAVLIVHAAGLAGDLSRIGAFMYVGGRAAYLPLYASGLPWVRTAAWQVATIGIVLVLAQLFAGP